MNRIDIVYGGKPYSLGGRSITSIQDEIGAAIAAGVPYWIKVNSGEGRYEDAYLLIAPGIPLAMVNVKPNGDGTAADEADAAADFKREML
ncbi:hypothetical protein E3T55_17035 [Cryobacterium frigoriphilum]|uniref:Uncharacterized protein n=1 Tax=Cryobacterium frigoriphilum TaxID=1259150 RepID=A0A4R8ZUX1_9MICO|nr:hypothetical protein [Cryobacterium frigoriphilum]TFD46567.1 hypothetical protein E3T55_17035 [Cryobacterium frigoriphilum]